MLDIFVDEGLARSTNSSIYLPDVNYVRRKYIEDIDKLTEYYRTRVYRVKSNHLLVQILNNLTIPFSIDSERILTSILIRGERVGKMFKLTSPITFGDTFKGVFFGNNVDEIIMYDDSYFPLSDVDSNWRNLRPVRVLYHPKSDLNLMLPNGKVSSDEGGVAVLTVNIGMLAVQYKKFMEQEMARSEDGARLDASYFVHMYVLPNILPDVLDWSIYNRMIYQMDNYDKPKTYFRHPIVINTADDKIDQIIEKTMDMLIGNRYFLADYLKHMFAITNKNMWYTMQLPSYAETMQSRWAILLSRIRIYSDMVKIGGPLFMEMNRAEINLLIRDINYTNTERVIREKASPKFQELYFSSMDTIKITL